MCVNSNRTQRRRKASSSYKLGGSRNGVLLVRVVRLQDRVKTAPEFSLKHFPRAVDAGLKARTTRAMFCSLMVSAEC